MTNTPNEQFQQPTFNQPPAANSGQMGAPTATPAQGAAFTEQELNQVRQGVFGALAYVSQADKGFFATFVESAAGARALGQAPEEVKQLLSGGGLVLPDAKSPEEFQATAMPKLQAAIDLVEAKNPQAAAGLKQVVLSAVQAVAEASKGTSPNEQQAIAAVQQALA